MNRVGIEKINIYGTSCYLDMRRLAQARGKDPDKVVSDYLINRRSFNPPYEDTVSMGVNAAKAIVSEEDKDSIGMLIVGTEGSVDFGKPISTNIHGALDLNANVRNYETKHACYSGVAALDTAVNWVAAGLNKKRKALVIGTDFSRMHLNLKEEFVMGGVAAAIIISNEPKVLEFELEKKGSWTTDVYDTFRPSAKHEVGNNEVSLYTYLDALEGSYADYIKQVGRPVDFNSYFNYNVYHTPFAGMAFQAHRTISNMSKKLKKTELRASFDKKVSPSIHYARQLGSTYSCSNFVGICSLLDTEPNIQPGDRISFFAYGSGAIGEFYSGIISEEAKETVAAMKIQEQFDARKEITVEEYENLEKTRESYIEQANVNPDLSILDNWFDKHYKDKGLYYLKEVKDFYRTYEWS